jgi:uncharacterized protein YrzB (UPF0473 family)
MAEHGKIKHIGSLIGQPAGTAGCVRQATIGKETIQSEHCRSKGGRSMDDIIILVDENGEEQEFELLDTVEYEGERYVVLIQDEEDSVVILKVESEEDEELSLVTCEDDVIEEVYHIFKEQNTDNFDFDD